MDEGVEHSLTCAMSVTVEHCLACAMDEGVEHSLACAMPRLDPQLYTTSIPKYFYTGFSDYTDACVFILCVKNKKTYFHLPNSILVTKKFKYRLSYIP